MIQTVTSLPMTYNKRLMSLEIRIQKMTRCRIIKVISPATPNCSLAGNSSSQRKMNKLSSRIRKSNRNKLATSSASYSALSPRKKEVLDRELSLPTLWQNRQKMQKLTRKRSASRESEIRKTRQLVQACFSAIPVPADKNVRLWNRNRKDSLTAWTPIRKRRTSGKRREKILPPTKIRRKLWRNLTRLRINWRKWTAI